MKTEKVEYTPKDMGIEGNVIRGVTLTKPANGSNILTTIPDTLKAAGTGAAHVVDNTGLIWDAFTGGAEDWDDYLDVLDNDLTNLDEAVADANRAFWQNRWNNIKNMWDDTTEVSIGAMIQTVAPYTNGAKFFDGFTDRLRELISMVSGTSDVREVEGYDENGNPVKVKEESWGSLLSNFADEYATELLTSNKVTTAASELSMVQGFATTLKSYGQFISDVQQVLKNIEPLIPYAELVWAWASSLMTGGSSVAVAANKTVTQSEKALMDILAYALHDIKKMVFDWKIKLPTLLVQSVNIMTVKDAAAKFKTGNAFLDEILSDDYYDTVNNSLVWKEAVQLTSAEAGLLDPTDFVLSASYVKNELASNAMSNILTKAYNNAKVSEKTYEDTVAWIEEKWAKLVGEEPSVTNKLNVTEEDIITISGYLIED